MVHAEDSGTVRLLSQVIQMWQEGTWKPDPNDLGKLIVDEPGHFVLFADDSLISSYSGAAMRDGQLVGRRISAPAFPNLTAAQGVIPRHVPKIRGENTRIFNDTKGLGLKIAKSLHNSSYQTLALKL